MRNNPDDLANQDLAEKNIHIKVLKVHANNLIKDLEEIYEALVGADGMERYTHKELLEYIHQLKTIEENEDANT